MHFTACISQKTTLRRKNKGIKEWQSNPSPSPTFLFSPNQKQEREDERAGRGICAGERAEGNLRVKKRHEEMRGENGGRPQDEHDE